MIISSTKTFAENCTFFADDNEQKTEFLQEMTVSNAQHGLRLDKFLANNLEGLSRHYLQQLIQEQAVSLQGEQVVNKAATKVRFGQTWHVLVRPTPQSKAFIAEPIVLDVVYQDEYILVINKPAGLVVHPAPGNWCGTLLNALLHYDATLFDLPRAGIVHRLDKDTSGLMVVARTRQAMNILSEMIAVRQISRQYLAACSGDWQLPRYKVVEQAIGRDVTNRVRMAVVNLTKQHGKAAKSEFRLVKTNQQVSLVHCTLHTGRTHQIRVHMKYLGYPLLADVLYGGKKNIMIERQALHAWFLSLNHPITNKKIEFLASLPADWHIIKQDLSINEQEIVDIVNGVRW